MAQPATDLLHQIPSPSRRLWAGLGITLSIFVVFALYAIHKVRWLEDFQVNVVQRNRKGSLQLLRLQNDAYLLAISLREMTQTPPRYRIAEWRGEFTRLRRDMADAVMLESKYAVPVPAADKRAQLRTTLQDFWRAADQAFILSARRQEAAARNLVRTDLESKRAVISEIVARLLVLNDRAQAEAAQTIEAVYGSVKKDVLILLAVLFLLALGTGLYTLQASGKTFERLQHFAEKVQMQSAQLRKLSWKLIDVQEETLRQVARDLHDEFGQILTAIGAMLGRAGREASENNSAFLQDLETVKKIVQDTLRSVRDRSQMFRPALLDDFGLEQTLKWFVDQFSRQAGITVHFEGKLGDNFFAPAEAIHVYRIVQEALSNVARHAHAKEAWVSLREKEGELNLEVRDDGVGFEVGAEMNRATGVGVGLMGMQERAQHLSGSLTIRSAPGKGTLVNVRVPMKGTAFSRAAL